MDQQGISLHYQRMEDWLNDRKTVLSKKFKTEYNHLLELSPRLEQMVRYDIPALHKQEKKLTSALDDAHRSIEEAAKASVSLCEKRTLLLRHYGLTDGESLSEDELDAAVDARIAASTTHLNESLRDFSAAHLSAFRDAYESFLKEHSAGMYAAGVFASHFAWLGRSLEECACPVRATETANETAALAPSGGDGESGAAQCEIDWGDAAAAEPIDERMAVQVQWDAASEGADDKHFNGEHPSPNNDNNTIIILNTGDELPPQVEGMFSIDVASAAQRRHVLTELRALRCFADERLLLGDDSFLGAAAAAAALEAQLTTSTEALFLRMRASLTLRHALVDDVQRFQRAMAAAAARRASSESRVLQLQAELEEVEPRLRAIVEDARKCRDECLSELQKMFPGRPITIVGDINKYL